MCDPDRLMLGHRWDCAIDEAREFVRRAGVAAGVTSRELRATATAFETALAASYPGQGTVDRPSLERVAQVMCDLSRRTEAAWEAEPRPGSGANPLPLGKWMKKATRHLPDGEDRVRRKQAAWHLLSGPPDDPIAVALVARLKELRQVPNTVTGPKGGRPPDPTKPKIIARARGLRSQGQPWKEIATTIKHEFGRVYSAESLRRYCGGK